MEENRFYLVSSLSAALVLILLIIWVFHHEKKHKEFYKKNPDLAKKVLEKQKNKMLKLKLFEENFMQPISIIFGFLFILIAIIGPIISIGYQIGSYLKKGVWETLSIIDVMQYYEIPWAKTPHDWFGLWNLFNFINIAFVIFFIFLFIGIGFLNNE